MDGAAEAAGREQRGTPSMRRRRRRRTSATAPRWDPAGRAFLGGGGDGGKVRVLAIDGCGPGPGDALLAVAALGADGWPRYTAADALAFVAASLGKGGWYGGGGRRRWVAERSSLWRVFGTGTLRDTVAPLLVPCYDLATAASFLLSCAGAVPLLPRRRRREDNLDFNG
uniref:PNPLA domain-containing protein n=1 Tax=Oryza glaberrima TaxID=4538 RepID=I1Q2C0_ORYGL